MEKFYGDLQLYIYFWQIKSYFVAKKLHKEIHFDIFHHATYANDWMASFTGALLPIPYVRGPGGGAHRIPKSFLRNFSFRERLSQYSRSIAQWIFRHDPFFVIGQNKAKALLVCNQEAFNALPEKWQKKAYFFPVNGVSTEDFEVLAGKESAREYFSIVTAGRLLKIKGFDLAIKAFKIFSDKVSNAKLTIIGDGRELKNLKNLVFELGIEGRVIFEGWMSREGLFREMLSCDVFLFASLRDGGGGVVVEAMAAGKPVVCFDIAGPGFHIDEKCGIKIKPNNPESAVKNIAKALLKLYFDNDLRIKLGKGAREKAEREYNWDKLGNKLNEIYKKVL
jgi:glycosyltransferase involved in cell wall biosynthesis